MAPREELVPRSARFRPEQRVKARSDFLRLQSGARRVHTPHFVLLLSLRADRTDRTDRADGTARQQSSTAAGNAASAAPNPTRVGITVTKKIGCAVERNRVKRLVREVFRHFPDYFPPEHDVVFIARAGAPGLGFEDVRVEVETVRGAMRAAAERNRKAARAPKDGARC